MNKGGTATESDDEIVISRVSPWKNKAEFNMIYDWLFDGNGNNIKNKRLALSRMKLWRMRRGQLTSASVLSTISILDVQLKDLDDDHRFSDDELRSMYANSFTRFVNYMSSIMRSRTVQSMYSTARELGMEPFLIDLRHLCAHGQVLPSLELARRTTDYCIRWLREFYWDRERNFIVDACVRDVRLKSSLDLEQSIGEWFALYDAATEAIFAGFKNVDDLASIQRDHTGLRLLPADIQRLQEFSFEIRHYKLSFIANRAINELAWLSNSNDRDRGDAHIYCDVLINNCEHFMKRSAEYCRTPIRNNQMIKFIGIHQNLFRMFAICDFINSIFLRFVHLCEDDTDSDDEYRKCAASFWAKEIATGFLVFKEFKMLYKRKKENNLTFDIDMAPINTDIMTDDIRQMYKELGVNYRGTLIFGDTVRRPWSLQFDRHFLYERAININEYTIDIVKKCIQLIEPALANADAQHIEHLISIYMDQDSTTQTNTTNESQSLVDDKIYTLEECLHENQKVPFELCSNHSLDSVWREAPDGIDWNLCPIGGKLP